MAIVTRYFSTTSAGAGDGTSWADRAELYSGGAWSTVITGFDFSASDSLRCLIGPGSYPVTGLNNGAFANPPTAGNPIVFHGCDSSGNILSPPDPDWTSAEPAWDDSGIPEISVSINTNVATVTYSMWRLIRFVGTASSTNPVIGANSMEADWCVVESSNSNTGAKGSSFQTMTNSVIKMTGTAWDYSFAGYSCDNLRIEGNASASSGDRNGIDTNTASLSLARLTVANCPGSGVYSWSASTSFSAEIHRCLFYNCGTGITLPSTASQTIPGFIRRCYVANSAGYGIDLGASRHFVDGNRLRDNTSGNFTGTGNFPTDTNYTTDSDDATELVDAGSGDYRIKAGSAIHGSGYGVADEPAAGGGGTYAWAN